MKRIIGIALIAILMISCSQPESEWKGSIDVVDGVTYVKNPQEPMYGKIELELEKDLVIGNEEDHNFIFYRIRGLIVDSDDNIYVVDRGNYRIQKYDSNGRYLMTIGQKGQGPGEFSNGPSEIQIDTNNNLYVREYRKMSVFDSQGEFIRSFPLNINLVSFALDTEGNLIGYADLQQRGKAIRGVVKIDPSGNLKNKFIEYTDLGIKIVVGKGMTYTLSPHHVYSPRLVFSSIGMNLFLYSYSSEYVLNFIDLNGTLERVFKINTPAQPITQNEKKMIISNTLALLKDRNIDIPQKQVEETLHFNSTRSYLDQIIVDDEDRIYVRRVKSILNPDSDVEFNILNSEGYYIFDLYLPFTPQLIRHGHLYHININETTGEETVIRYKIKNWDQLKTGIK